MVFFVISLLLAVRRLILISNPRWWSELLVSAGIGGAGAFATRRRTLLIERQAATIGHRQTDKVPNSGSRCETLTEWCSAIPVRARITG